MKQTSGKTTVLRKWYDKLDVEKFKFMAVVGKNGRFEVGPFFTIFIFMAHHKTPKPSINGSTATITLKDTPG